MMMRHSVHLICEIVRNPWYCVKSLGRGGGEVAMKMWHCHGTFLVPANNHAFKDNDALHCDIKFFIDLLTI